MVRKIQNVNTQQFIRYFDIKNTKNMAPTIKWMDI